MLAVLEKRHFPDIKMGLCKLIDTETKTVDAFPARILNAT
jgi:hypothetical protein